MAITRSRYSKSPVLTGYDLLSNYTFLSLHTMKDISPCLYVEVTALQWCNLVLDRFTSDKEVEDVNMQISGVNRMAVRFRESLVQ